MLSKQYDLSIKYIITSLLRPLHVLTKGNKKSFCLMKNLVYFIDEELQNITQLASQVETCLENLNRVRLSLF